MSLPMDKTNKKNFGWCFIGSGSITERVVKDMIHTNGSYPATVYSRSYENTCKFAEKYNALPCRTTEEALNSPSVKAVYVATPHTLHKEHSLLALQHGLPVLCEKPLATTFEDASEMIRVAREKNLYLLDGLWTGHNPVIQQVMSWLKENKIGQIRSLSASFSFYKAFDPTSRLYDPKLGGGALLDVGVYTILLACMVFGEPPAEISATADYSLSGVDSLCSVTLRYQNGAIARLFSGISANEPHDAYISGSNGYIHIPTFWAPKTARVHSLQDDVTFAPAFDGEGFQFQFDAAVQDIQAGNIENAIITHDLSLQVMSIIDQVRKCLKR